jgi:hypothetical protein
VNQPEIKTDGESWQFLYHDLGVAVGFELLREKSDGLHGELWVGGDPKLNGNAPHIIWGTFNLSSPTARSRMATQLTARPGGKMLKAAQWAEILEYACIWTAQDFRKGEPAVDLADEEVVLSLPFLVRPLLPERQPTILYADGETGKGWLALGICLSLRLGGEVLPGLVPARQCNSLYLDWESDKAENVRRQEYICRGLGLSSRPNGIYYRKMYRPLADDLSKIRDLVAKTEAELIVIDSIGLAAATGGDIKESEPAMRLMAAVRMLNVTALLLGHVPKASADQRGSNPSRVIGSTYYQLLARSCWELKADAEVQPVIIGFNHRKSNMGARQKSFALQLNFEDEPHYRVRFERCGLEDSAVVAERAPLIQRMIAALRRGPKLTSELADELDVSEATMRTTLNRALHRNVVVQLHQGGGKGSASKESMWGLAAFEQGGGPMR